MVVFVDLDDEFAGSAHLERPYPLADPIASEPAELTPSLLAGDSGKAQEDPNPNRNGFSAALSCYPYVFVTNVSENLGRPSLQVHSIALSRKLLALSI